MQNRMIANKMNKYKMLGLYSQYGVRHFFAVYRSEDFKSIKQKAVIKNKKGRAFYALPQY